jgi:hypothetical protein
MLRLLRSVASVLCVAAPFSILAGCSSAGPGEPTPTVSSEGLDCASAGIHFEGCPIDPPPPSAACVTRPDCAWQPKTSPGYDVPFVSGSEPPARDTTFTDELTATGCQVERYYEPLASYQPIAIAACPALPAEASQVGARVVPCDECTGKPPAGWVVVAWSLDRGPPPPFPPPGCGENNCVTEPPLMPVMPPTTPP